MLLYGDALRDPRVRREASSLVEDGHQVSIATLSPTARSPFDLEGAQVIPIRPSRRARLPGDESPYRRTAGGTAQVRRRAAAAHWLSDYAQTFGSWVLAARRTLPPADVWHGHDLLGLVAASLLRHRHGGVVIHDSHELYMEAGSAARLPSPIRSLMGLVEGRASRSSRAVITVNRPIAAELHRRYGVDPVVVMNCPPLQTPPTERVLRSKLRLGDRPVVVHHGVLGPGRGLEQLVDSIPYLPARTAVVLLGGGPLAERLSIVARQSALEDRLFVVPPVPLHDVRGWIADADVGVIPFQAVDRNNVLGTPNKLFEYLEAAVPIVVSQFPEMSRIALETGAGISADAADPRVLGAAIRSLLEERGPALEKRRSAARRAAESTYNWETQAVQLRAIYADIAQGTARSRA